MAIGLMMEVWPQMTVTEPVPASSNGTPMRTFIRTPLQEFLLAELIRAASLRSPGELVRDVAERQRTEGGDGFSRVSSAEVIRQDRDTH